MAGFRPPAASNAFGPLPRLSQQGQNVRPVNAGARNLPTKPMESATTVPTPPTAPAPGPTGTAAVRPPVQPPKGPKGFAAVNAPTGPKAVEKRANTATATPKPTPAAATPTPAATAEAIKETEAPAAAVNGDEKPTAAANGQEKKSRPEPKTEKSEEGTTSAVQPAPRPKKHELFVRGFDTPVEEATLKSLFPGHEDNVSPFF
jgi:hypothetical protein